MDTETILVVDDEEAIREVVSTMLESRGYRCTAVSNGRAAQDQVRKNVPDLVLSDMIMPEMDGIKLLEWLRNEEPEVPVIMVTAIHDISTALEAIRRGAYDYILKPFEKDQLFLGVGRALQHRRLVMENRNYQRNLEQQVEERTAQLTGALSQLEQQQAGNGQPNSMGLGPRILWTSAALPEKSSHDWVLAADSAVLQKPFHSADLLAAIDAELQRLPASLLQ